MISEIMTAKYKFIEASGFFPTHIALVKGEIGRLVNCMKPEYVRANTGALCIGGNIMGMQIIDSERDYNYVFTRTAEVVNGAMEVETISVVPIGIDI